MAHRVVSFGSVFHLKRKGVFGPATFLATRDGRGLTDRSNDGTFVLTFCHFFSDLLSTLPSPLDILGSGTVPSTNLVGRTDHSYQRGNVQLFKYLPPKSQSYEKNLPSIQALQAKQGYPQHVLHDARGGPVHRLGGHLRPLLRHQQAAISH